MTEKLLKCNQTHNTLKRKQAQNREDFFKHGNSVSQITTILKKVFLFRSQTDRSLFFLNESN